jgi:hypothetical protein
MDEIIEFSGLGNFIEMPFRTYSSGMQLRLAFAVSTTVNPQILIMDEWLSTGDENFRERAEQRMRRVVDTTDILILASHSRQLLQANCDRIIWLEHGRVRRDGEASKVLDEYLGPETAPPPARESVESEDRMESIRLRHAAKAGMDSAKEVRFSEEELPGNHVARILGCRLVDEQGKIVTSLSTSLSFCLEVEYLVKEAGHFLWTGVTAYDETGVVLFWSADTNRESLEEPREPGVWVSKVEMPARLLASGVINFSVGVSDSRTAGLHHSQANRILSVSIEDDLDDRLMRGYYRGPILGVVRPRLNWQSELVQKLPVA